MIVENFTNQNEMVNQVLYIDTCMKCKSTLYETENFCDDCESIIVSKIKIIETIIDCISENVICNKLNIRLISNKHILKMYLLDCGIGIVEIIREFSLGEIKTIFGFSDIEMIVVVKIYFT